MHLWAKLWNLFPERGRRWFMFAAVGVPSFLVSIPLNIFLVEYVRIPIALAYAIALVFQVTVNFLMCRWFVFESKPGSNVWRDFALFFPGISLFRFFDWLLYNFLVYYFGLNFVAVQILNVFLFSALKFLMSERIFEGRRPGRQDETA